MITPYQRTLATIAGRYDPITDTGYYGFVEAKDLITGDKLSEQLDFNVGINHNTDAGWLKFYIGPNAVCNGADHQKVIYVARMSLKHSMSWDDINSASLITGNRTINIGDNLYKVRLLTGGMTSPGTGSEWNELLYRLYIDQPKGQLNWRAYDNAGLNVGKSDGRYSWTQETDGRDSVRRVYRGYFGWYANPSCYSLSGIGWRPVLELLL